MRYKYELLKILPKNLWVQVKYTCLEPGDYEPIFKNFIVEGEFTEENITEMIKNYAHACKNLWQKMSENPEEVTFTNEVETELEYNPYDGKEFVQLDQPVFDPFTQYLEHTETITDTQVISGFEILEYSEEERIVVLNNWREAVGCSMRQARLALSQQGLLAQVESSINALPIEQKEKVLIEWEYGSRVERNSPWVNSLGPALGLTDLQLDELFKLALTL